MNARQDPATGHRIITVGPGELYVTRDPATMIRTVLGSCVAACIRDPIAGVGGLNHFMLPESDDPAAGLRYGNIAMQRLIEDIQRLGGHRDRLEAKLFGGACFNTDQSHIGDRNAAYAAAYLTAAGITPLAHHFGGTAARRVLYNAVSGRAFMQKLQDSSEAEPWPSKS